MTSRMSGLRNVTSAALTLSQTDTRPAHPAAEPKKKKNCKNAMTPNQLAAHIAAIRKDLAADSAQNAEALVLNLLREHDAAAKDELDKSINSITELRTQLAEAQKDKERLDWLSNHPLKAEVHGGSDDGHGGTFWAIGAAEGTLRQAIDTAMKGE